MNEIYISYRRDTGREVASALRDALRQHGLTPLMADPVQGVFDVDQILGMVTECAVQLVLIWTCERP